MIILSNMRGVDMTAEDIVIKREITVYEQKIAAYKSRIKQLKKKLEGVKWTQKKNLGNI